MGCGRDGVVKDGEVGHRASVPKVRENTWVARRVEVEGDGVRP